MESSFFVFVVDLDNQSHPFSEALINNFLSVKVMTLNEYHDFHIISLVIMLDEKKVLLEAFHKNAMFGILKPTQ